MISLAMTPTSVVDSSSPLYPQRPYDELRNVENKGPVLFVDRMLDGKLSRADIKYKNNFALSFSHIPHRLSYRGRSS